MAATRPSPPARVPVVAIDGPSGSGKGTVSRLLALQLGWHFLDSGALYRLVALAAQRRGVALDDSAALAELAASLPVSFGPAEGEQVFFGAEEVSEILRSEKSGEAASQVARLPVVRRALLERQRAFARAPGLVADGRDMGTVVFPDAVLKVFLTATPEERAHRRHKQLKGKGIDVSLPDLSREIAERDRRDASRSVAPLRPAEGARVVDSTGVTVEEVLARITRWLAELGIG
ncbi:MAG TPA: (d)CMP kinase [Gammaproteobacteria bacterium]